MWVSFRFSLAVKTCQWWLRYAKFLLDVDECINVCMVSCDALVGLSHLATKANFKSTITLTGIYKLIRMNNKIKWFIIMKLCFLKAS